MTQEEQGQSLDVNGPDDGDQSEDFQEGNVEEGCEERLVRKDEELKGAQDRILRLAAEMDNTRKRLERERSESIAFANESIIRSLLPVIDNLERAVSHGESDANFEALMEGVRMTLKAFENVLGNFGVISFDSVGEPFDPNFHEALSQVESAEHPEKTVVQEFEKGYLLNDRLLRAAKVLVTK